MGKYIFSDDKKKLLEKAFIPFGLYQFVDKEVVCLVLSKGFLEVFGYDDFDTAYYDMNNNMYVDTHPDDVARIVEVAIKFAENDSEYDVVYRTKNNQGDGYIIIHAIGRHYYTETGDRLAQVWYINEGPYEQNLYIKQSQLNRSLHNALAQESAINAKYIDFLTGLPSVRYFVELAEESRSKNAKSDLNFMILFMDFSGMRHFNTKYDYKSGDKLLKDFAKILVKYFGNNNCCRYGQDHFTVFTTDSNVEEKIALIFKESELLNDGNSLPLRVGIYKDDNNAISLVHAIDRAKVACDELRNNYVSVYKYFDIQMNEKANLEQYIIENIDNAIENKWIQVYYQPIVRAISGRVCDEEALARWDDPNLGMLSPGSFIPILEKTKLIYKLDLYVLEEVLRKMQFFENIGLRVVPQSINLSRSDFDSCDIVEEVRRRVDDAFISHDMITIEITESILGSNFEYIKSQISRFQALGFAVWMDDFGSGYSSLNVLRSIRFDLIKFDIRFLENITDPNNNRGKVLLSELIKLATLLGFDTVCEGVETIEQVKFLQEIGCSKLQGFYYVKPIPVEEIIRRYKEKRSIGFEEANQSDYFEMIGRANLNELSTVSRDDYTVENYYKTIPMALIEEKDGLIKYTRTNNEFKIFLMRNFDFDVKTYNDEFVDETSTNKAAFAKMIIDASNDGYRSFVDLSIRKNSVAHFLVRRMATNKTTGINAVVVAIVSISKVEEGASYAAIARAFSKDYFNMFYVDIETEKFIEYNSEEGSTDLRIERHGENFFTSARADALKRLYSEDRMDFVNSFTKENVLKAIKEQGNFSITYRILTTNGPIYVSMKAMLMDEDNSHIIVGVSNIDKQMKEKEYYNRIKQDQATYNKIMALSGDYICLYSVDMADNSYFEYSASKQFEEYGLAKSGKDFFEESINNAKDVIYQDDLDNYMASFSKEQIKKAIKKNKIYTLNYHLADKGKPIPVCLRAAIVKEDGKELLIVGVQKEIKK